MYSFEKLKSEIQDRKGNVGRDFKVMGDLEIARFEP